MASQLWFTALILAVGAERLVELVVARRNSRWSFDRGGVEYGRSHYPLLVALHSGLLVGALAEVWIRGPEFAPALGIPMLALVIIGQALRWWCIATLGPHWNTRVIVVPGTAPVRRGPYRLLHHPNYLAVVIEGAALPLVHGAWITSVAFTVLNAAVLTVRIRVENRALASLAAPG
jgi:methyltransferase